MSSENYPAKEGVIMATSHIASLCKDIAVQHLEFLKALLVENASNDTLANASPAIRFWALRGLKRLLESGRGIEHETLEKLLWSRINDSNSDVRRAAAELNALHVQVVKYKDLHQIVHEQIDKLLKELDRSYENWQVCIR
jgi:hypothetical protein